MKDEMLFMNSENSEKTISKKSEKKWIKNIFKK